MNDQQQQQQPEPVSQPQTQPLPSPRSLQDQFIELRARGLSFAKIAEQIGVTKKTLIAWSRKFQFEIQNSRCLELERIQHEILGTREERTGKLGVELNRILKVLRERDPSTLSTSRLYSIAENLRRQIVKETGDIRFTSSAQDIPKDEYCRTVHDWTA